MADEVTEGVELLKSMEVARLREPSPSPAGMKDAVEAIIDAKVKEIDDQYRGAGHRAQQGMGYAIDRLSEVRDAVRALDTGEPT